MTISGIEPATSRFVASCLTHYATARSNRNEYQEYFRAVRAAGAYSREPYHLHMSTVSKSGSPTLLEPSGPIQDCSGIDLPFQVSVSSSKLYMKVVRSSALRTGRLHPQECCWYSFSLGAESTLLGPWCGRMEICH
jgi:hypothetical protein